MNNSVPKLNNSVSNMNNSVSEMNDSVSGGRPPHCFSGLKFAVIFKPHKSSRQYPYQWDFLGHECYDYFVPLLGRKWLGSMMPDQKYDSNLASG